MQQMTIDLDFEQQRPVVIMDKGLTGMLDTGAYIPVWTSKEELLIKKFNAELIAENVEFTGFGGSAYGNLYKATFQVGKIIYPEMSIIANNDMDVPFNMILSATMFQNLIYEIDDKNHKLNVTIPDDESMVRNLHLEDRDGNIVVLCNSVNSQ